MKYGLEAHGWCTKQPTGPKGSGLWQEFGKKKKISGKTLCLSWEMVRVRFWKDMAG